jgi:hypothetical protein
MEWMDMLSFRSAVAHDPADDAADLARDLDATWPSRDSSEALHAWLSRPALLRRVAEQIARRVPAACGSIIAAGAHAAPLGAAVGLVTGVRWAVLEIDGETPLDEAAVVAISAEDAAGVAGTPLARIAVIGEAPQVAVIFRHTFEVLKETE